MYYELYIDVFFLVNFMMDYLLLQLVRRILKCPATHGRICIGALTGAFLMCTVVIIPGMNAFVRFILFHGVINIVMIKTGFKIGWNRTFLRACILLYICAFLLGGVMEYLHQYIRAGSLFFALAMAGYYISLGIWNLFCYLAARNTGRCTVRLMKDGRECTVEALIDTGNRLRDSVTGKPVSIISGSAAERLSGRETKSPFEGESAGFRYIPYHSVGKAEGLLPVFVLDSICICRKEEIWVKEPVVAVSEADISDDDYEMLVNPDLL